MLLEAELMPLRERYRRVEGDEAALEIDVTNGQLTALKAVLDQDMPPDVDVGVWGPHGKRLARKQRSTAQQFDLAGNWRTVEQAGLPTVEAWRGCWGLFSIAAIMLGGQLFFSWQE